MANCSSCGESTGSIRDDELGRCLACANANKPVTRSFAKPQAPPTDNIDRVKALREKEREARAKIGTILLTTETAPNLNIKSRVGIIMADADCAFDVAMVKNKDALLSNLKSEAHTIGANAVVGVTFNMIETYSASIGIGKVNTFKLLAYGTAVIIETEEGAL
jgi:uncharacterized protein YbjQ (UPF0145 family)